MQRATRLPLVVLVLEAASACDAFDAPIVDAGTMFDARFPAPPMPILVGQMPPPVCGNEDPLLLVARAPASSVTDVDTQTTISLSFERPLRRKVYDYWDNFVELECLLSLREAHTGYPVALQEEPWLGMTTYACRPSVPLKPATTYVVGFNAAIGFSAAQCSSWFWFASCQHSDMWTFTTASDSTSLDAGDLDQDAGAFDGDAGVDWSDCF